MPAQRIKGQEVELILLLNGKIQQSITTVKDFELTLLFDKKSEGYLGETTERKDEIYKGVDFKGTFHFATRAVFDVFTSIANRAKRRDPGAKVNIKAALNFPNGERLRVLIPDAFFGNIPVSFPGREEYGSFTLDGSASDYTAIPG